MKRTTIFILLLATLTISYNSLAQGNGQNFKMEGINPATISINKTFSSSTEVFPFDKNVNKIFGLAISADIKLNDNTSLVRVLLVDENYDEHLIYENYLLLEGKENFSVEEVSEETSVLKETKAYSIKIEIRNAEITLISLTYCKGLGQGINIDRVKKEKKQGQNAEKIAKINKNLRERGLGWIAGPTEVAELSYAERKQLYGQSTFPAGFEFYAGGVISAGSVEQLKSASASLYVEDWDWRNRHGKNWITPVTNQGSCGSCWAFAATGATEAMANVFFNQQLNLNLSEQDVLSCSGGGDCAGGYPSTALTYIAGTGVVDEAAFPYIATYQSCLNKSDNPIQRIKIAGRVDFGSTSYPRTEDDLKRMLIQMGPASGGLYDWSHAMVLVGYKVVKEGDVFYYRDLNLARSWKTVASGDALIGKTVWIFKNSWGPYFGDAGYVYVETAITNFGWTHALKTPVSSETQNYQVNCVDVDGDGYYFWGLGTKPANCPACPDQADGNDADPKLGPLDAYGFCKILTATVPVSNFTANKTTITAGESVTFSDLSTNSPTSWSWSFTWGTPETSNVQNPTVTYSTPGVYNVTLTASNSVGSNTKISNNYITVNAATLPPVASFTVSKTIITAGESVNFTDLSTNSPTSWSWSFTGGTPETSTVQNPTVTYATPGVYNVTLTATNAGGSNLITLAGCITVNSITLAPVADFTADNTVITKGTTINFSDISINNPSAWEWSFTGAAITSSTVKNPSVKFDNAGTYDVILKVSNSGGTNSKTVLKYITVTEPQPIPPADYCVPSGWNSLTNYISSVVVSNGIKNTTLGNGFTLYDGKSMITGKLYTISMTPKNITARYYWRVWIDYNGDGDFNDVGETVLSAANKKGTFKSSFTVPAIANSQIRMRVAMKTLSYSLPCDNSQIGEVEDYGIAISAASSVTKSANANEYLSEDVRFILYPNPADRIINIDLSSFETGNSYSVFSLNGQKMTTGKIMSTTTSISVADYTPGIYILEVNTSNNIIREKFIKK